MLNLPFHKHREEEVIVGKVDNIQLGCVCTHVLG